MKRIRTPTLAMKAFWTVVQAFKRDPIYINEKDIEKLSQQKDFIPVSHYCENFPQVIRGEIGISGLRRLIIKNKK